MEILRVYGKRANAPETLIFGMLIDAPAYRATGETSERHERAEIEAYVKAIEQSRKGE